MVNRCTAIPRLLWLANVIIALAHTGLRISELAGLRWSDVDLNSNTIRVADERSSRRKRKASAMRITKGRRSRVIPIHPRLRQLFEGLSRKPDGRVLHAERGGVLRPNNVLHTFICDVIESLKEKFPTPADEIGFEHGRLHSFRHFSAAKPFSGVPRRERSRSGSATPTASKMVEHYCHPRNEAAQRKMEQIDFIVEEDEEGITQEQVVFREALRAKMKALRVELAGSNPTPIERLLVERVVACWLQLAHADCMAAQARPASIAEGNYIQRRQDRAHRRYLSAIKMLAVVRKLALAIRVDLNLASRPLPEHAEPAPESRPRALAHSAEN